MNVTLFNDRLTVDIATKGAELQSIRTSEREYLWQGDEKYWGRRSPVLFPVVGSVWEGRYRFEGKEYEMNQHGFARDMEFSVVRQTETEVLFSLDYTEDTLKRYPYRFRLQIGYILTGSSLSVTWQVINLETERTMHFQIGAHPAFYWDNTDGKNRGSFVFDGDETLHGTLLHSKGCIMPNGDTFEATAPGGVYPMKNDTLYAIDTLVLEHHQVHSVQLRDTNDSPIVRVRYDAPVVGIWTPTDLDAPFVCIEPWYGRCDRAFNEGEFENNDWVNHIAAGRKFHASYTIDIY